MTDTLREPTLAAQPPAPSAATSARPWWRIPPVDRHGLVVWILAYVVMAAIAIGAGYLLVHQLGAVRSFDDRVARWLSRHRTDAWDDATWVGSVVADVYVKVPATLLLSALFLWRWRRWTEPALLAGALLLEVAVFVTTAIAIDRPRPPIAHLDPIPPTGSFPSGHSAAAVAFYGAIAIVVCWHARSRLGRGVAVAAAFLMPLVVGASRMYRGMHRLSDVVVGLVIGAVSLWVTWLVVRHGPAARAAPIEKRAAEGYV
jgi:membrane-associated phospholipid phosphatase